MERARVLEMFREIAVACGDAHHLDVEVVDTGTEVWKWGLSIAGLDRLVQYQSKLEHLELEED